MSSCPLVHLSSMMRRRNLLLDAASKPSLTPVEFMDRDSPWSADLKRPPSASLAPKDRSLSARARLAMADTSVFFEMTTIHGLVYMTPTYGGALWQRLVWVGVVVACFAWASVVVHESYTDWWEHPVETAIKDPVYSVTNVQVRAEN